MLTLREMPINPFLWHVENARAARWRGGRSGCGRRWLFTEKQGKQRVRATVNSSILLGAAVKTTTHLYFLVSSSDLLSSAQLCSALLRCLLLGCCNFPNHFSGSVGKLFKRLTSQPPPKTPFSRGGVACRQAPLDRGDEMECQSKRQRRGFKSLNNFYVSHYSEVTGPPGSAPPWRCSKGGKLGK